MHSVTYTLFGTVGAASADCQQWTASMLPYHCVPMFCLIRGASAEDDCELSCVQIDRHTYNNRQTHRQTGRQIDRYAKNRHTDRHNIYVDLKIIYVYLDRVFVLLPHC